MQQKNKQLGELLDQNMFKRAEEFKTRVMKTLTAKPPSPAGAPPAQPYTRERKAVEPMRRSVSPTPVNYFRAVDYQAGEPQGRGGHSASKM